MGPDSQPGSPELLNMKTLYLFLLIGARKIKHVETKWFQKTPI